MVMSRAILNMMSFFVLNMFNKAMLLVLIRLIERRVSPLSEKNRLRLVRSRSQTYLKLCCFLYFYVKVAACSC